MEILFGGLLLAAVVLFVMVPLRRDRVPAAADDARLADLEARKEAKLREIRDTELDHAAGKLSDEDFRRQDTELRREAIEILKMIDQIGEGN